MEEKYKTVTLMASSVSGVFGDNRTPEQIDIDRLKYEVAKLKAYKPESLTSKIKKAWRRITDRLYLLLPMRECSKDHYED